MTLNFNLELSKDTVTMSYFYDSGHDFNFFLI